MGDKSPKICFQRVDELHLENRPYYAASKKYFLDVGVCNK